MMVCLAVEAVALALFHQIKLAEIKDQKKKNAELQAQIANIEAEVKNHNAVKQQLQALRAREEAITKLQSARTGPTAILLELAKMLTPGRGPSVDPDKLVQLSKDNPLAVFNTGWDSRRLWLLTYKEAERTVKMEGFARDGEDVSELARRLNLSNYFFDVKLLPGSRQADPEAKVRY
jgi:type IV pilus assembly protein PilN